MLPPSVGKRHCATTTNGCATYRQAAFVLVRDIALGEQWPRRPRRARSREAKGPRAAPIYGSRGARSSGRSRNSRRSAGVSPDMEDRPRVGWTGVELRHLEALRAVAEEMSFRGAARRLGFGQSAISQQIALLERRVGARLVDRPRGGKTVGLTPSGALLLRHEEAILDRVALAERELAANGDAAALRIGVFQSVGAHLLPPSLALAQRARAGLQLELVPGDRPAELLRRVACGDLDMTFAEEPPDEPQLRAHALLDDPYVLLAPAGDDSIPTEPVPLAHLIAIPLLTYDTSFHTLRV